MTKLPFDSQSAGNRLKQARELRGIKQSELAKVVKKNLRTIVRWEADGSSPSMGDWALMAAELHVSRAWLISGEGPMGIGEPAAVPQTILETLRQSIEAGKAGEGAPQTLEEFLRRAADAAEVEGIHTSPEGVNWKEVIQAHDEVMAYIEMSEAFSGQTSEAREKRPEATRQVYLYIHAHGGTPSLRDMNAIMREI